MKWLKDFMDDDEATYDDLVRELFALEEDGIDDIITLIFMRSGLGRLEFYDMILNNIIRDYDNLKEWRDEVGELT